MTSAAMAIAVAVPAERIRRHVPERPANERELVLAAQRGQRSAFSELVRMHERRAYAVARAIVLSHEDAEDLAGVVANRAQRLNVVAQRE